MRSGTGSTAKIREAEVAFIGSDLTTRSVSDFAFQFFQMTPRTNYCRRTCGRLTCQARGRARANIAARLFSGAATRINHGNPPRSRRPCQRKQSILSRLPGSPFSDYHEDLGTSRTEQ